MGIEPMTSSLPMTCSTTELRQPVCIARRDRTQFGQRRKPPSKRPAMRALGALVLGQMADRSSRKREPARATRCDAADPPFLRSSRCRARGPRVRRHARTRSARTAARRGVRAGRARSGHNGRDPRRRGRGLVRCLRTRQARLLVHDPRSALAPRRPRLDRAGRNDRNGDRRCRADGGVQPGTVVQSRSVARAAAPRHDRLLSRTRRADGSVREHQ